MCHWHGKFYYNLFADQFFLIEKVKKKRTFCILVVHLKILQFITNRPIWIIHIGLYGESLYQYFHNVIMVYMNEARDLAAS